MATFVAVIAQFMLGYNTGTARTRTYAYIHTCTHIRICMYIYKHTCMCIHTYLHTCTHIRIHIHIHTLYDSF